MYSSGIRLFDEINFSNNKLEIINLVENYYPEYDHNKFNIINMTDLKDIANENIYENVEKLQKEDKLKIKSL